MTKLMNQKYRQFPRRSIQALGSGSLELTVHLDNITGTMYYVDNTTGIMYHVDNITGTMYHVDNITGTMYHVPQWLVLVDSSI